MIGKPYEYEAMAHCETDLWWYKSLHDHSLQAISRYNSISKPQILDAGCGTGGLLKKLQTNGYDNLTGFDLSEHAVQTAGMKTGLNIAQLDILKAEHAYQQNYFDVIISHDILCLLPTGADKAAMNQLVKLLRPGGVLIMNLPALGAFRGTHDLAVGINKRYNRKSVLSLLTPDCTVQSMTYWPFILSLPVYLTRLGQRLSGMGRANQIAVSDVKMPGTMLNQMLYNITSLETKLIKVKPWGSSLFTVIRKSA